MQSETVDKSQLPPVDDAPSVVLSAERLTIGTQTRVSGGIRLRKQIVTESVTRTVQVRREVLVPEQVEPGDLQILHPDAAVVDPYELREDEFEIVLHEEHLVITTVVVPVERIRVRRQVVTEQVEVAEVIRREHVDLSTERFGADVADQEHP